MEYYPVHKSLSITLQHLMTEKVKFYKRFKSGIPDYFDTVKVVFQAEKGGLIEMTISVNGKKKIVVPLSPSGEQIMNIFGWLESLSNAQEEYKEYDKSIEVGYAGVILLHYEPLDWYENDQGLFYLYGSWTGEETVKDRNASAFCLKSQLIKAFYESFEIFMTNQYDKNKIAKQRKNPLPEWEYPFSKFETFEELQKKFISPKLVEYVRVNCF